MARNTGAIQADIEVTRRLIERQLDTIQRRVPNGSWTSHAALAGAATFGFLLSWVPFMRLIGASARTVRMGVSVGSTLLAVDRFLAARRTPRAA